MKKLKTLTLDFLRENITNVNDAKDIFETIITFSENDLLDDAKNLIDYSIRYQSKSGFEFKINNLKFNANSVFFLKAITIYLTKIDSQKEIGRYLKSIRHAINQIEKNFDEHYLLFYTEVEKIRVFDALENAVLTTYLENLAELLNYNEFEKDAINISRLKGKIELGLHRYIHNKKTLSIIKKFIPLMHIYEKADDFEILKIISHYKIEESLYKSALLKSKANVKNENEFSKILFTILEMKRNKDKAWKKEFDKIQKYLQFIPQQKITIDEYQEKKEIEKSLFFDFIFQIKEFKKENIVLVNLRQLKTANLIAQILKDE